MLPVVVVWVVAMLCVAAGGRRARRVIRLVTSPVARRLAPHVRSLRRRPPSPVGRPIEAIARDAQRLSLLFHYPRHLVPGILHA